MISTVRLFITSFFIFKNIASRLFSVHNIRNLSRHEKVCLMRLHFKRYFCHHWDVDDRAISQNEASLNILVQDVKNLSNHFSYFFLKLIISFACSLKDLQNFLMQSLPLYTSCLFSMLLNDIL